jgi:hypothetical protein
MEKDRIAHGLVDRAFQIMDEKLKNEGYSLPQTEKEDKDGEHFENAP